MDTSEVDSRISCKVFVVAVCAHVTERQTINSVNSKETIDSPVEADN